jgi:hypothetical protein
MERRVLIRSALMAVAAPGVTRASFALQDEAANIQYQRIDLAAAYGQAFFGVTRNTELAARGQQLRDALLRGSVAALAAKTDEATQHANQLSGLIKEYGGPINTLAQKRGIPQFGEVTTAASKDFPAGTAKLDARTWAMPVQIPRRDLVCALSCLTTFAGCAAPDVASSALACGIKAAPALRAGAVAYAATVLACLVGEYPDIAATVIVNCSAGLTKCLGGCSIKPSV